MQEGPLLLIEVELTCVSALASGHYCDMSEREELIAPLVSFGSHA